MDKKVYKQVDKKKFSKDEVLALFRNWEQTVGAVWHEDDFLAWFKKNVTDVKLRPGIDYIDGPVTGCECQ